MNRVKCILLRWTWKYALKLPPPARLGTCTGITSRITSDDISPLVCRNAGMRRNVSRKTEKFIEICRDTSDQSNGYHNIKKNIVSNTEWRPACQRRGALSWIFPANRLFRKFPWFIVFACFAYLSLLRLLPLACPGALDCKYTCCIIKGSLMEKLPGHGVLTPPRLTTSLTSHITSHLITHIPHHTSLGSLTAHITHMTHI